MIKLLPYKVHRHAISVDAVGLGGTMIFYFQIPPDMPSPANVQSVHLYYETSRWYIDPSGYIIINLAKAWGIGEATLQVYRQLASDFGVRAVNITHSFLSFLTTALDRETGETIQLGSFIKEFSVRFGDPPVCSGYVYLNRNSVYLEIVEKEIPTPPPPVLLADFDWISPLPLTVDFTNMSRGALALEWSFGDGLKSTEANPRHYYTQGGDYKVVLTVFADTQMHRIEKIVHVPAKLPEPPEIPATITANPAKGITQTGVTLSGYLDIGSYAAARILLEYGLTTKYEKTTFLVKEATSSGDFSTSFTGLTPGTTYHFRFRGYIYGVGSIYTNDMIFTTLGEEPPIPPKKVFNLAWLLLPVAGIGAVIVAKRKKK